MSPGVFPGEITHTPEYKNFLSTSSKYWWLIWVWSVTYYYMYIHAMESHLCNAFRRKVALLLLFWWHLYGPFYPLPFNRHRMCEEYCQRVNTYSKHKTEPDCKLLPSLGQLSDWSYGKSACKKVLHHIAPQNGSFLLMNVDIPSGGEPECFRHTHNSS